MIERVFVCSPPLIASVQKAVQYRLNFCAVEIVAFKVSSDAICLTLSSEDEPVWRTVRKKVEKVVSSVRDGFIPPEERMYAERRAPQPSWAGVGVDLEETGHIQKSGEGRFVVGPLIAGLIERLDRLILELAGEFDAKLLGTPALISADVLSRVDYFRAFPHSLTFAYHLPPDVDVIEQFAGAPMTGDGQISHLPVNGGDAVLSPAVCFHLDPGLGGKKLDQEMDSYTMRGRCFRYESKALSGLERLWDFTMREIVFVGEKDAVMAARKQSMEWVMRLADRLGLLHRIQSASDPFFVGEFRQRTIFQAAFDLKYEWRVDLDTAQDAADLAVGSFNIHQTHFGKAFQIQVPSGETAWTGCMAFGLERLALGILRQHGISAEGWPEILRTDMSLAI